VDFIGQNDIKENLKIFVEAAKKRNQPLDHVLFYGPPGLGKTTLAHIIANELNRRIKSVSAPVLEKQGDLVSLLTSLEEGDILFIDELHRLRRNIEEILYQAMEDYKVDIVLGKGPMGKVIKLNLPKFTLIGATTRAGMLTLPLRNRFAITNRIDYYTPQEIFQVIKRSCALLGIDIGDESCLAIAKRARGTPRIANNLLKRIKDYADIKSNGVINLNITEEAFSKLGVDELGLDKMDRRILEVIIKKFNGGPVGIKTLTAALSESIDVLEDIYEPYLIRIGFIQRTPRGSVLHLLLINILID
jgi:Holliday junction DNA helicase RuvB